MDPAVEERKPKGKKRPRRDIITRHLDLYGDLKARNLHGVLIDSAVWICAQDDVVHALDCLCLGNLDGGAAMADHVRCLLLSSRDPKKVAGAKAVRLSLDEAFFMAFALQALTVHTTVEGQDGGVAALDTDALWRRSQSARQDFVTLYLAYHHFRSKGWIPRTGLQYGVDFVLYQRHPAIAHSDYSVLIQPLNGSLARPPLTWHDLQVTNRLTAQVGKRLLILYVKESGSGDHSSPECVFNFAVEERIVRRWVPESQRHALTKR